jgi:anti-sigma regulatory factor (Ser/Thr protein kinase)
MAAVDIEGSSQAEIDVTLPADATSIPQARALVDRLLTAFSGDRANDVRLAVTEACANVARHAYVSGDERPTFRVAAWSSDAALQVLIEDGGRGLGSHHSAPGLGLGLVLIRRLADDARIEGRAEGGTAVRMTFRLER